MIGSLTSFMAVCVHGLSVSMCFAFNMALLFGITLGLYSQHTVHENSKQEVCTQHYVLGAQRKAENRNTGLQRKLKHSLALCKQPVVNSSVILHLQKIPER